MSCYYTINHAIITVLSFAEMGRYLLSYPGVKFLFSERFTQDHLESFFRQKRQRGGGSDNPNVLQFTYTTSSIRAQKSIAHVVLSKVRGSKHHQEEAYGDSPLTKRPRHTQK